MNSKRDFEQYEQAGLSFEICERCRDRIRKSEVKTKDNYCGDCRNRIAGE